MGRPREIIKSGSLHTKNSINKFPVQTSGKHNRKYNRKHLNIVELVSRIEVCTHISLICWNSALPGTTCMFLGPPQRLTKIPEL